MSATRGSSSAAAVRRPAVTDSGEGTSFSPSARRSAPVSAWAASTRAARVAGPEELGHADRAPGGEGLVRGPDPPKGGADPRIPGGPFPGGLEEAVIRKNHGRAVRHQEVVSDGDPGDAQLGDLFEERGNVQDDAGPMTQRRPRMMPDGSR